MRKSGFPVVIALVILSGLMASCKSTRLIRTGDPRQDLQSSDPLIVGEACAIARRNGDSAVIPLLIENLRSRQSMIRIASYECLLDLLSPELKSQLEIANVLFGYSAALPPKESSEAVQRVREWYEAYTGDAIRDLQTSEPISVQLACLRVAEQENLDAIPYLLENLRNDDFEIRSFSYTAFVALVSPEGHDPQAVHTKFNYQPDAEQASRASAADTIDLIHPRCDD